MMARRRMSGRQLASTLGVSPAWVSYRLTGAQEIGLNDLQRIADVLGVEVHDLLPPRRTLPRDARDNTLRSSPVAVRPMPKVGPASRKPDNTRPSSPRPRIISRPLTASK